MAEELILVVDDGKDNRDFLIEHVLQPNGYRHLVAIDGHEGYQMAMKHRPDLILLDLQMPRMSGIQVIEALANQNADIPIILMTFHGSEEIAVEVFRMGVRNYVKKPYYAEEMLEAIDRALSETRLRREKEALTERVLLANRELQRRLRELNTIYKVGKSVTSVIEMDKLLPHIVDAAVYLTGAEESHLVMIENRRLVRRAYRNQLLPQAKAASDVVKDSIAAHVIRSGASIVLNGEEVQVETTGRRPVSVAYAPLILHERVLGAIGVANYTSKAPHFSQNDGTLLSAISDYAAIAIENSRNYAILRADRAQILDTFERFVPPSIVAEVLAKPKEVAPGGKRQEISVLFADIRGYSTWSENLEPEQVLETLNNYLSYAAGVIIGWEGTLDKFLGDGLMAIFNAPTSQPDHVYRAADAALALLRGAQEVNAQYGHQLSYSVGVHVGEAIVGYVGMERALNYTAIGDTVNLAKRLQEYAAPNQILVDDAIIRMLGSRAVARPLGEIKVKGRKTPTLAYELLDLK